MASAKLWVELDMGGQKITNGAAGVNPTDFAIVSQLAGGATGFEILASSAPTSIANGSSDNLPVSHVSGDSLVDDSTPAAPLIIDAGVYGIAVQFRGSSMTAGGIFAVEVDWAAVGLGGSLQCDSRPSTSAFQDVTLSVSFTSNFAANGYLVLGMFNGDGSASRDFAVNALYVQRIS